MLTSSNSFLRFSVLRIIRDTSNIDGQQIAEAIAPESRRSVPSTLTKLVTAALITREKTRSGMPGSQRLRYVYRITGRGLAALKETPSQGVPSHAPVAAAQETPPTTAGGLEGSGPGHPLEAIFTQFIAAVSDLVADKVLRQLQGQLSQQATPCDLQATTVARSPELVAHPAELATPPRPAGRMTGLNLPERASSRHTANTLRGGADLRGAGRKNLPCMDSTGFRPGAP